MQQPPQISSPPMEITTEQIQKCLDENKQLIMAILENQNLGKFAECTLYQNQLQQNLMYLARIADAQPQASQKPLQMTPQSLMHQEPYALPSQPTMSQHQQGFIASKVPLPSNGQQQQHQLFYAQQQLAQGQLGMKPAVANGSYLAMHTGSGSKQEASEAGN